MSTTQGWFYLHVNNELIYKNNPDAIIDIRDSDLCHSAWSWEATRSCAWRILIEALSLGANSQRIADLAKTWECTDSDATIYADLIGVKLGEDGDKKTATRSDFENLQDSPCGFGDTYLVAMADLCRQLGFRGGKMWGISFEELVKKDLTVS